GVGQNRELITAERCRTENVDEVKCVFHEIAVCPAPRDTNLTRASGIKRAFMQARSLSAGPVIAASIAAGMPLGSEGNAQPASRARAHRLSGSAPTRIGH